MLQSKTADIRRPLSWSLMTLAVTVAIAATFAMPSHAQMPLGTSAEAPALARAEVLADLALWRRAGVDRFESLANGWGMELAAYRLAHQEYLRLRASDQFQIEVQKALRR